MKAINVRLGHATNSSSAHSVVISRTGAIGPEFGAEVGDYDFDGGWEKLILADDRSKLRYLMQQVHYSMPTSTTPAEERAILSSLFPELCSDDVSWVMGEDESSQLAYIDHQSIDPVDPDDVASIKKVLLAMNVGIVIDNDNSSMVVNNTNNFMEVSGGLAGLANLKCITLRDGRVAVLYNSKTGAKVRLVEGGETYEKGEFPELVDISITDYCSFGCSYCYRGSTTEGKHAKLSDIEKIADSLVKCATFEVALGGGEPTTHPEFKEILQLFLDRGITPNFTTYTANWIKDKALLAVACQCGGIGVSIPGPSKSALSQMTRIRKATHDYSSEQDWSRGPDVVAQLVVGAFNCKQTITALENITMSTVNKVLLLGYKETGRGKDATKYDESIEVVNTLLDNGGSIYRVGDERRPSDYHSLLDLSVDTKLVAEHHTWAKSKGGCVTTFNELLVTNLEGKYSMFIDAVAMKTGKSSFAGPRSMTNNTMTPASILRAFKRY